MKVDPKTKMHRSSSIIIPSVFNYHYTPFPQNLKKLTEEQTTPHANRWSRSHPKRKIVTPGSDVTRRSRDVTASECALERDRKPVPEPVSGRALGRPSHYRVGALPFPRVVSLR
ncbi:hypothetical protein HNY73_006299 [Argiope bruennichi]|uniref:Uncharacterized protein n=1 Tax=Argiope bruennichi TaxID=94029 RepID=A0A8T0FMJ2_ARGBR|nr:hypothetical protein HNY73_006299 [Argiope bruennichi]